MEHRDFGTPESVSPEDRERMERLAREARDVLTAAEAAPQEELLQEGRKVLEEEEGKEVEFVENAFGEIFHDPKFIKELFEKFENDYGWHEGKSRAMLGTLRHALNELYYRMRTPSVDERDPHPEGQTRDTRNLLLSIIADDYGAEVMRDISPLVDIYVERGHELIKESKKQR
jgi:hypothetical protein